MRDSAISGRFGNIWRYTTKDHSTALLFKLLFSEIVEFDAARKKTRNCFYDEFGLHQFFGKK